MPRGHDPGRCDHEDKVYTKCGASSPLPPGFDARLPADAIGVRRGRRSARHCRTAPRLYTRRLPPLRRRDSKRPSDHGMPAPAEVEPEFGLCCGVRAVSFNASLPAVPAWLGCENTRENEARVILVPISCDTQIANVHAHREVAPDAIALDPNDGASAELPASISCVRNSHYRGFAMPAARHLLGNRCNGRSHIVTPSDHRAGGHRK